jgi:hypothetical protein
MNWQTLKVKTARTLVTFLITIDSACAVGSVRLYTPMHTSSVSETVGSISTKYMHDNCVHYNMSWEFNESCHTRVWQGLSKRFGKTKYIYVYPGDESNTFL